MQTLHIENKFQCKFCDNNIVLIGNLSRHMQALHKEIKYQCNVCDCNQTLMNNLN